MFISFGSAHLHKKECLLYIETQLNKQRKKKAAGSHSSMFSHEPAVESMMPMNEKTTSNNDAYHNYYMFTLGEWAGWITRHQHAFNVREKRDRRQLIYNNGRIWEDHRTIIKKWFIVFNNLCSSSNTAGTGMAMCIAAKKSSSTPTMTALGQLDQLYYFQWADCLVAAVMTAVDSIVMTRRIENYDDRDNKSMSDLPPLLPLYNNTIRTSSCCNTRSYLHNEQFLLFYKPNNRQKAYLLINERIRTNE